jgi:phage-related protein
MVGFRVSFYDKPDGTEPAKEFILSLDKKMRAKMLRLVSMLEENGPDLREPYSKPLMDGIFELRAQVGSDITRVLYFFIVGKRVILTNGFIKKTEKTPPGVILTAKEYRAEYSARKAGGK